MKYVLYHMQIKAFHSEIILYVFENIYAIFLAYFKCKKKKKENEVNIGHDI